MTFLLDTQVWLWLQASPDRVPIEVRARLADQSARLLLSAASAWEIAIKYAIGKLPLPQPPDAYLPPRLRRDGVESLPITQPHALRVAELPRLHTDPFDRVLVAQAELEKVVLVTADPQVPRYEVDILWAGPDPGRSRR